MVVKVHELNNFTLPIITFELTPNSFRPLNNGLQFFIFSHTFRTFQVLLTYYYLLVLISNSTSKHLQYCESIMKSQARIVIKFLEFVSFN